MDAERAELECGEEEYQYLLKYKIIKQLGSNVHIDFLDDNMDEVMATSKKNSVNAALGWQKRKVRKEAIAMPNDAVAMRSHSNAPGRWLWPFRFCPGWPEFHGQHVPTTSRRRSIQRIHAKRLQCFRNANAYELTWQLRQRLPATVFREGSTNQAFGDMPNLLIRPGARCDFDSHQY